MSFQIDGAAGPITGHNNLDDDGNPAGGMVRGRGFEIVWQDGPLVINGLRHEPNGAFVEDVVTAVLERMRHYQSTRFGCRENALVITKLEEAIHWMQHRTAARTRRGVEGTHQP